MFSFLSQIETSKKIKLTNMYEEGKNRNKD